MKYFGRLVNRVKQLNDDGFWTSCIYPGLRRKKSLFEIENGFMGHKMGKMSGWQEKVGLNFRN